MSRQRRWQQLLEFPGYELSSLGEFVNARTDREVRPSVNQQGHLKISLMREGRSLTRSVALLVAETYVEKPDPMFDTPIHLNGDLRDCCADNLMWRPRWFAIRFHKQFMLDQFHLDQQRRYDVETNTVYESLKEVCTTHGLYYHDVLRSCIQGDPTPITYQEFRELH